MRFPAVIYDVPDVISETEQSSLGWPVWSTVLKENNRFHIAFIDDIVEWDSVCEGLEDSNLDFK